MGSEAHKSKVTLGKQGEDSRKGGCGGESGQSLKTLNGML